MKSPTGTLLLIAALAGVATVTSLPAQTVDAWVGTWKLNLARSTYDLSPAPLSGMSKIEPSKNGWKMSTDGVDAQGNQTHTETTAKFDGKDYPFEGVGSANITYAFTRIDDHHYELVSKLDGKVRTTTRTVVSPDGKTRTSTTTGRNAEGQMVSNVAVYDKQ